MFKRQDTDLAISDMLVEGEQVLHTARIHDAILWKGAVVLIFGFILAVFVWQLGVLLGVFGLLILAYEITKRHLLLLVLTNKRVLARYGVLQVDVVNLHFDKIESLELERMLPGYIFGYSNVIIMGTGNRFIAVPYVANGPEFRKAFNEITLGDNSVRL